MAHPLPRIALWLGLAGLIPFLACALAAAAGPDWVHLDALDALCAYGAVILPFLGAVHWGLALRAPESERPAETQRLVLGVVPSLLAWVAILLPLQLGLALLALGLLGTAAVETVAAGRGLVPPGYLALRWGLSLGAALCLIAGITVA